MLVLSRKLNEKIQVGDDISITVLEIKGNRVRIGIEAPQHVRVIRSELPPKQPGAPLKLAAASEDISSTSIAFVPMRKPELNRQAHSQTVGTKASVSSRARLQEIRQAANQRNRFQIVAATENSPVVSLPIPG